MNRRLWGGAMLLLTGLAAGAVTADLTYHDRHARTVAAAPGDLCADAADELCLLRRQNHRLANELGERLAEGDLMVAAVESMTGGLFTATLLQTEWAGRVVAGSLTTYNAAAKAELLEMEPAAGDELINEATAVEMLDGLRDRFEDTRRLLAEDDPPRDLAVFIAFTGAATHWRGIRPRVHIAVAIGDDEVVETVQLDRSLADPATERQRNMQHAVNAGLRLLLKRLGGEA